MLEPLFEVEWRSTRTVSASDRCRRRIGLARGFLAEQNKTFEDITDHICTINPAGIIVHFFVDRQAGEKWIAERPGTFLMSL